jgi:hypothetical protein
VEPAHAGDEAALARVEPGQLHRPLDGVGAVADEEAVLEVAGSELSQELGKGSPQGIEELLRGQRHALELRLHRPHDFRVVDARGVDAVPAQAVDEAPSGDVLEVASPPAPLHGRELAALGDGLPVLEVAPVVVGAEVLDGLRDDPPPLVVVELVRVDEGEPAPALLDDLLRALAGGRGRGAGGKARDGQAVPPVPPSLPRDLGALDLVLERQHDDLGHDGLPRDGRRDFSGEISGRVSEGRRPRPARCRRRPAAALRFGGGVPRTGDASAGA